MTLFLYKLGPARSSLGSASNGRSSFLSFLPTLIVRQFHYLYSSRLLYSTRVARFFRGLGLTFSIPGIINLRVFWTEIRRLKPTRLKSSIESKKLRIWARSREQYPSKLALFHSLVSAFNFQHLRVSSKLFR